MSGHSKWAQIKRSKGAADVKRGALFTKLGREISVAVREGGPNPEGNPRLRLAIQRAREANMPADTIDRSIKRGSGPGEGVQLDEITYEGYGPAGSAIMVQAMTENRNRTASEVRALFTRAGGNLGESGSVAWQFDPVGAITIESNGKDPEEVAMQAIDAGAQDFELGDGAVEIYTLQPDLDRVRRALEAEKLTITNAELSMRPKTTVSLGTDDAIAVLRLVDKLEDLDDALFHYLDTVLPAVDYEQTCSTSVAVIAGQVPQRERLLECLSNPGAFIDEYVARDEGDESQ